MAVLGVDIGTSGCRAMAFDAEGRARSLASAATPATRTSEGRAEVPAETLLSAFAQAVGEATQAAGEPIEALCCSCYGGALCALDAGGRPLLPVIGTTDTRAVPEAAEWVARFGRQRTYEICGLPVSPTLNLLKVMSVRREQPEVFARTRWFVSPGDLALHSLGAPVRTDLAMASTWMALDLRRGCWSEEILAAAEVDRFLLPALVAPGEIVARMGDSRLGLPEGVALVAGGHDQQVCALGAGLTQPGGAVDSLGSVECVTIGYEGARLDPALGEHNYMCLHHVYGGLFVTLGYNFGAGDLLRWYRSTFHPGGSEEEFGALLAALPERPGPLLALPHFAGSGPPSLDALSRGALLGLSLASTPTDILHAIIASQNFEIRLTLELWQQAGLRPRELRVHGGGSRSDPLLQTKADVLNLPVHRLSIREAGCLGAAALAAAAIGQVSDAAQFLRQVQVERAFEPRPEVRARYEDHYQLYRGLYEQLRPLSHRLAGLSGGGIHAN